MIRMEYNVNIHVGDLRYTEIGYFQMAIVRQQNVIRLDVLVDDIFDVQKLEARQHFDEPTRHILKSTNGAESQPKAFSNAPNIAHLFGEPFIVSCLRCDQLAQ